MKSRMKLTLIKINEYKYFAIEAALLTNKID